ncbi:MAG: phosphatase PAP2 family protein [Planctomycetota bacterium]
MFYKSKLIIALTGLIVVSILDIFWFKSSATLEVLYLNNNRIKYTIAIINDTLKLFWYIFPSTFLLTALISRHRLYKQVSINNLIHILLMGVLVLFLKFSTGKARPQHANNPFDYNLFKGYLEKNHDSFPSGETAMAFVQTLYLLRFVKFKTLLVIFSTLTPLARLALYRHWWFDCAFSIFLSVIIIKITRAYFQKSKTTLPHCR